MKTYLECIPCFIKQSLEASRMATDDEETQSKVLKEVMKHLQNISFTNSPPELSREIHEIIRRITNTKDPYKNVKDKSNETIKNKYPILKKIVNESDDPLLTSIKLSIVGNVIDFGTMNRFNVDEMIENALNKDFDNSSYKKFKNKLDTSKTILFLADNTGEIFFDKLLIEKLKDMDKKIIFVVKENPIINDALTEDAELSGISKMADILTYDKGQKISTPGVVMQYSSDDFKQIFKNADMIISKGQGNYEGLSDVDRDVFFMLVAKCPLVAKDIDCEVGKLILRDK